MWETFKKQYKKSKLLRIILWVLIGLMFIGALSNPKDENVEVAQETNQIIDTQKQERELRQVYRDAFMEGCLGEGASAFDCSCWFNVAYNLAGGDIFVAMALNPTSEETITITNYVIQECS
jgi:hypothetical protein